MEGGGGGSGKTAFGTRNPRRVAKTAKAWSGRLPGYSRAALPFRSETNRAIRAQLKSRIGFHERF